MSGFSQTSERNLDITSTARDSSIQHKKPVVPLNGRIKWLVYGLLAAFCIYRLIAFRPVPLDAPGTLRPVLYAAFSWFVGRFPTPEDAFSQWSSICSLALLLPPALAVLHFARRHSLIRLPFKLTGILCSRQLFFATIAVCLLLCRFPTLLQKELNPDEGAFIAAANKLFFDPNFFHAVDNQTNGPLNVYPLMVPAIFGISPDFASSRILVIVIILLAAVFFYRTVAVLASDDLARFAVLPFVTAMAVFNNTDLRHYSSEYVPLLLISIALYLAVRILCDPGKFQSGLLLIGVLSSAAFFSKLQSVPIVLSLGLVALAYTYKTGKYETRWRPLLLLVGGAVPLTFINLVMCLSGGVWKDFWIAYIRANVYYAQNGSQNFVKDLRPFLDFLVSIHESRFFLFSVVAFGVAYLIQRLWRRVPPNPELVLLVLTGISGFLAAQITLPRLDGAAIYTYLAIVGLWMIPIYCGVIFFRKTLSNSSVDWFGFLTLAFLSATVYAIYAAHREFPHYLLFLFLPLSTAISWMLIKQAGPLTSGEIAIANARTLSSDTPRGLPFIGLLLVLTLAYQTYEWSFQDVALFRTPGVTIRTNEGDFVRSVTDPGPTVFVWGWNPMAFLASGRAPATRDLQVVNCFRGFSLGTSPPKYYPSRQSQEINDFYINRILRDLHANRPQLFVDSASSVSMAINDRKYFGFERWPELDLFVKTNYVLLTERLEPGYTGGQGLERYYLRRDLLAKQIPAELRRSCIKGALTCLEFPSGASLKDDDFVTPHTLLPEQIPTHVLIEAEFVPIGQQAPNATVFNSEVVPQSFRGFRFQHIAGDRYRLVLGLGDKWAFSKSVLIPDGKRAYVSVELNGDDAYLRCNGIGFDYMHLASPVVNPTGPITVGSWIDGQWRFSGAISFFQIRELSSDQQKRRR